MVNNINNIRGHPTDILMRWLKAAELYHGDFIVSADGENKFRIYGDAAEYMDDDEGLKKLMKRLVTDDDYRLQWTSNLNENMEVFLMNNFFRPIHMKPSELGANAIDKLIKHKLFKHNNYE